MAAAALAIPAIIGGITSLIGGFKGSSAAKKAAEQQAAASAAAQGKIGEAVAGAQKAEGESVGIANDQIKEGVAGGNKTLADVFAGQQTALQPYLKAGEQGVTSLADMFKGGGAQFSFNPTDLVNEPGYQFQLGQGLEAIKRQSQAGGGAGGSGGTLAGLMKYGQGLAGTTYQQAYDRALGTFQTNRTNTMQGLMSLAGIGQTGTAQYNQAAQNFGNTTSNNMMQGGFGQSANTLRGSEFGSDVGVRGAMSIADLITQAGNAKAAGTVGSANAWSSALSGIGNAATGYAQNRTLQSIFQQPGVNPGFATPTRPFSDPGSGIGPSPNTAAPSAPYSSALPSWMTPNMTPSWPSYGGV